MASSSSSSSYVVGTVKGPGETGNQYVFITSDTRHVKIGEYVYYELSPEADEVAAGQPDRPLSILGKISDRSLIEHLPDRIFADTEISPQTIAALVGFTDLNPEIYEVTVDVIGHFEKGLGFMNPRCSPNPGAKVILASDDMLKGILSKKQVGEPGSAHIGSILLRGANAVPVAIDVK